MTNTIRMKRSSTPGKIPAAGDLQAGELAVNTSDGKLFLKKSNGAEAVIEVGPVASVAGRTGAVSLSKADVGLANADNTSDALKPVSIATKSALDGKSNLGHAHAIADVTSLQTVLDAKAAAVHAHVLTDVGGLQAALEGKAASVHTHSVNQLSDSTTAGRALLTAPDAPAQLALLGLASRPGLTLLTSFTPRNVLSVTAANLPTNFDYLMVYFKDLSNNYVTYSSRIGIGISDDGVNFEFNFEAADNIVHTEKTTGFCRIEFTSLPNVRKPMFLVADTMRTDRWVYLAATETGPTVAVQLKWSRDTVAFFDGGTIEIYGGRR